MRTPEEIVALYHERKKAIDPIRARAIEVRDTYNGDVTVPLPEMDKHEKVAVANLLQQGLDHMGMRISSTQPDVYYPPVRPGIQKSDDLARQRRQINMGWWRANKMNLKDRKRARWLVGYASTPVIVRPGFRKRMPIWRLIDPLMSFPPEATDPDEIHPEDLICVYQQTLGWLGREYETQAVRLEIHRDAPPDTKVDIVEYVNAEQITQIVLGKDPTSYQPQGSQFEVLENVPNRAETPLGVVPGRITLDRPMGQYDGIVGLYQAQAKLMALEVIAVQRGIFPDEWFVSADSNRSPKIITKADGKEGIPGIVSGGTYQSTQVNPTYLAPSTIDRLEYAMRQTAGIASEFGGQSAPNIRTGRRGEQVMSAAVDPWVQEAQELLAASKEVENRIAVAVDKAYWGSTSKSIFIGAKDQKAITYTPTETFETDENVVTYSFPGTDVGSLTIQGGSLVGMGVLPKREFARLHPLTQGDPEGMLDEVTAEGLEEALLQAIQSQAASGTMPAIDVARIRKLVRSNKMSLEDAIQAADKEARARQAEVVEPGAQEAQPGLALPGQGAESVEAIAPPEASMGNLRNILGNLRLAAASSSAERGLVRSAQ